jgi:hypothetical protein
MQQHGDETFSLFKGFTSVPASKCRSFAPEITVCCFSPTHENGAAGWNSVTFSSTTVGGRSMAVAHADIAHKSAHGRSFTSAATGYEFPLLPFTKAKLTLSISIFRNTVYCVLDW